MTGHDDDLSPWNDDPLVRALRGPGTADELGGEAEFTSPPSVPPSPLLRPRSRASRSAAARRTPTRWRWHGRRGRRRAGRRAPQRRRTPRTSPTPCSVRSTACSARSACPAPETQPRERLRESRQPSWPAGEPSSDGSPDRHARSAGERPATTRRARPPTSPSDPSLRGARPTARPRPARPTSRRRPARPRRRPRAATVVRQPRRHQPPGRARTSRLPLTGTVTAADAAPVPGSR